MKEFPENIGFRKDDFSLEDEWEFDDGHTVYILLAPPAASLGVSVINNWTLCDYLGTLITSGKENVTNYVLRELLPDKRRRLLSDLLREH